MKIEIITNCLDLLTGFEHLTNNEKKDCFSSVIDTLGSYPKPQKKTDIQRAKTYQIASYLFVSTARNYCKLSIENFIKLDTGINVIQYNLESALSILTDNQNEPQAVK